MKQKMTTPTCGVRWAFLSRPKPPYEGDGPGAYTIFCLLNPSKQDHNEFLAALERYWDAEYKATCAANRKDSLPTQDKPWRPFVEEGVDTGLVALRPKNKEYFMRDGKPIRIDPIPVFDTNNNRISVEIGNGSTCRVSFQADSFYFGGKFGVTLRLRAVQVVDLVKYDPFGFAADEIDGYEAGEDDLYVEPAPVVEPAPAPAQVPHPVAADAAPAEDELPF